jgi:hypothetical protein
MTIKLAAQQLDGSGRMLTLIGVKMALEKITDQYKMKE